MHELFFLFMLGIVTCLYWTCAKVSWVLHTPRDHEYHGRKVSYTVDL